jgi:hypothetical protein
VTIAPPDWRIDYEATADARAADSIIRVRGDRLALNHRNQTWYALAATERLPSVPTLFDFFRMHPTRLSKLKVDRQAPNGDAVDITFTCNTAIEIAGARVSGRLSGRITLRTMPVPDDAEASATRHFFEVVSGLPELDDALRSAIDAIPGGFAQMTVETTRAFEGGARSTQSVTITLQKRSVAGTSTPDVFQIPQNYTLQRPVYGTAGQ